MPSANTEKPRWSFYLEWVGLNALTIVLAWYITWALITRLENVVGGTIQVGGQTRVTEDFLFLYVLFPTIGLLTGILQYFLLRRYLPRMPWWIAATLLGWLLPFVVRVITLLLALGNSTLSIMLGLFLVGALIALPQWVMLRQRVPHALWWVPAYALGWSIVGLLNYFTTDPFPVLLAIAVIPTIGTAIACWLLLDGAPKSQIGAASLPVA